MFESSKRRRIRNQKWMFDSKRLFKYKNHFYVFKNLTLREKFINKCYNNFFTNYFNVIKTYKLFARKYY